MAKGFVHTVYKGGQWVNELEEGEAFGASHATKEAAAAAGRTRALKGTRPSKHIGLWSEEDGREPVGLHDLRHSAASFYFDAGWKTREVSRLLRHANPTVTLTVYAGLAPAEEEEILENALTAFGGAS